MITRIVEPVGLAAKVIFPLREATSCLRHATARMAVRRNARLVNCGGDAPKVNYGRLDPCRGQTGLPIGGEIKLIPLKERFPEAFLDFNLVYLVSSALPPHAEEIVAAAKSRGARVIWNQNGVAYPGCYGDAYPWLNRRMAWLRSQADYIVNQSAFSRDGAERYLGPSSAPSEICLNPVDIGVFSPAATRPDEATWQILAAGTSHAFYRTKSAIDTLRVLLKRNRSAKLIIAGEFRWRGAQAQVAHEMRGVESHVTILPPFRQSEAPGIYRSAHVLLHTKFNDPCPTVPIEAMACGVPVVATRSGGLQELVPRECGVLAPVQESWTHDLAGDPIDLADAIEHTMCHHSAMAVAAREHAVRELGVDRWLDRHEEVFRRTLAS